MNYKVVQTRAFSVSLKQCTKRGLDEAKLWAVVEKLQSDEPLPPKNRDHKLRNSRDFHNCRECHIEPDWLLVYQKDKEELVLLLVGTGTHADLFN